MIFRLVDVIVGINAVIAISAFVGRRLYVRGRRPSNLEHVRQLEEENKELDKINERMQRRG